MNEPIQAPHERVEAAEKTRAAAIDGQTIRDFGEQWTAFRDNSGFYGSTELLADIFEPLLSVGTIRGLYVGDIGSGSGRIVNMLLDAGAAHVTAVEPSAAFDILVANTSDRSDRVTLVCGRGEEIPRSPPLDLVVSIGVLHHVVDPISIMRASHDALKPGGHMLVWLYGREGNELYLTLIEPLRKLTRLLPHFVLVGLCYLADMILAGYATAVRLAPKWFKASDYLINVYWRLANDKRRLVIYDQLNPQHAHYYTRAEAIRLMQDAGFKNILVYHRHGYSWTLLGERAVGHDAAEI